jgi:ubiquinone/menaquinone biosynthesis C-methylase UbiE
VAELEKIASLFPAGARVLEIGAGTGKQALELQRRSFEVSAIELADSNYAANRVFPIKDYDGRSIPLPDASVDVVFSSNVLEHVPDLSRMHAEIRRVLAPHARRADASPAIVLVHHVLGADHRGRVTALDVPQLPVGLERDDDLSITHGATILRIVAPASSWDNLAYGFFANDR